MLPKRQLWITIVLGLLGFVGAFDSWQYQFADFELSFTWSNVFPLMAALAYGSTGGFISGVLGLGALFPFSIWQTNGYANIAATLLFLGWFVWHGFWANRHKLKASWISHAYVAQTIYAVLFGAGIYLFYPPLFPLNPPSWQPTALSHVSRAVLDAIVGKSTPLMFLSLVMAYGFLLLPPVRKFMQLPARPHAHKNLAILFISIGSALLFWNFLVLLDAILLEGSLHLHPIWAPGNNYEAISLLVMIFVGFVVAYAISIFSEKQLLNMETLRISEERMNTVLENVDAYIFIKDQQGRYTYANRKVIEMFKHPLDEIIGKSDEAFFDRDAIQEIQQSDQPVLRDGLRIERKESALVIPGYPPQTFLAVKVPLVNPQGQILGLCGISTNITLQENIAKERENLLADLQAKNAELLQFTYTASHDLRTPLINIRGFLNELREDLRQGLAADVERDLQFIDHSAIRMGDLLKDLLELSRSGRSTESPHRFELAELVQEVLALFNIAIADLGCQVITAPSLPQIFSERNRVFQILQNLIDNAIKYRRPDQTLQVELGGEIRDDGVYFWVKDNGIGISKQYHKKVFGLFEKLNNNSDGTGIGLALVARHMDMLKGLVWVESLGTNQGTTIWLQFPHEHSEI